MVTCCWLLNKVALIYMHVWLLSNVALVRLNWLLTTGCWVRLPWQLATGCLTRLLLLMSGCQARCLFPIISFWSRLFWLPTSSYWAILLWLLATGCWTSLLSFISGCWARLLLFISGCWARLLLLGCSGYLLLVAELGCSDGVVVWLLRTLLARLAVLVTAVWTQAARLAICSSILCIRNLGNGQGQEVNYQNFPLSTFKLIFKEHRFFKNIFLMAIIKK